MSEIMRFTSDDHGYMFWSKEGKWVRYQDHQAEVERLRAEVERLKAMLPPTAHTGMKPARQLRTWTVFARKVAEERDAAQAEVERLTAERDAAQAEQEQLRAEVERLRANGQGMLDTSRPTDEDIWREVFLRCVSEYITGEKRVIVADSMLAEYRKRWPR